MNNVDLTSFIAEKIREKLESSERRLILVGIEGKGCTGKSRMSHSLKDKLEEMGIPSQPVSIDDFCNPRKIRYDDEIELGLQVYFNNFDEKYLINNILKRAYTDQRIKFEELMLDAATDTYTNKVEINLDSGGVLLVEGLHILREKYAKYLSLGIFLYISDKEQLKRALIRDKVERGINEDSILHAYKNRFVPSYNYFLEHGNPFEYTDIFVDYEDVHSPRIVNKEVARGMVYGKGDGL